MRVRRTLISAFVLCSLTGILYAAEKYSLRVLYIGDPGTPRAQEYARFLNERFVRAEVVARKGFNPSKAAAWDVVLLDWPQSEMFVQVAAPGKNVQYMERTIPASPLGARESWSRPTVLLGSAGLLLADAWKIGGGNG